MSGRALVTFLRVCVCVFWVHNAHANKRPVRVQFKFCLIVQVWSCKYLNFASAQTDPGNSRNTSDVFFLVSVCMS